MTGGNRWRVENEIEWSSLLRITKERETRWVSNSKKETGIERRRAKLGRQRGDWRAEGRDEEGVLDVRLT